MRTMNFNAIIISRYTNKEKYRVVGFITSKSNIGYVPIKNPWNYSRNCFYFTCDWVYIHRLYGVSKNVSIDMASIADLFTYFYNNKGIERIKKHMSKYKKYNGVKLIYIEHNLEKTMKLKSVNNSFSHTIQITFESKEEMSDFWHRMNINYNDITKIYGYSDKKAIMCKDGEMSTKRFKSFNDICTDLGIKLWEKL